RRRRAGGGGGHHHGPGARVRRRHRRAGRPHRAVHPRRAALRRRRRARHQLPPAPLVAARPRRRLRRAPLAAPVRHRPGRGLPLPQLRRRHVPPRSAGMTLSIEITDRLGPARAGTIRTARGEIQTPCFMPVGTKGAVRTLSSADLEDLGAQIILGNTYHLMLKPGAERIARLGGLHAFEDWPGHLLTDSGGYQVFSLDPGGNVRLDDEGVTFRSTYDGGTHRLTPASAVDIQTHFGSDIHMFVDVCARLPWPLEVLRLAVDRTAAWAATARDAFLRQDRPELNQFGFVQGGTDLALRAESAERTVAIGFDGYAVGG